MRDTIVHATDSGVVIETKQDCTEIIEENKKQYNVTKRSDTYSDSPFGNKIASIPLTVIDHLNSLGILRGFHVVDEKKFKVWLNDSENMYFRTRTGRV